jgi:ligand-binding sensor domain-containing protein/signal transduction histidine kinase
MSIYIKLLFLFVAVELLLPQLVYTQPKEVRFEHLTIDEGLSENSVMCIYQDSKGFLWFGTGDGLNRYDGYEFVIYKNDIDDSTSIGSNYIVTIYEDIKGTLWFGTWGGGLNKYNFETETFTRYVNEPDNPNSLNDNSVLSICEDNNGFLWLGTISGGLNRFNPETESFFSFEHNPDDPSSLSNNIVPAIYIDKEGILWAGTGTGGLNKMVIESSTADGIGDVKFIRFQHQPDNPYSISNDIITGIIQDPDDSNILWVATRLGGVCRLDKRTEKFYRFMHDDNNQNSLSSNIVYYIYFDQSGRLWVGTFGGGLNYLNEDGKTFTHFKNQSGNPNSLSDDKVISVFQDRVGNLWFGTHKVGINKLSRHADSFSLYRNQPGSAETLSSNFVTSVYEDNTGYLWVGTQEGLNRFDRSKGTNNKYFHDQLNSRSISHNWISVIYEDSKGNLWFGTYGGGFNKFKPKDESFTHYQNNPSSSNSLSSNKVMSIVENDGFLWIGTRGGGLDRFDVDTEGFKNYSSNKQDPSSLSNSAVRQIYKDRSGKLWLATNNGLNLFNQEIHSFSHFFHDPESRKGLSDNRILFLNEDSKGNYWVGTLNGLNKLTPLKEDNEKYRNKSEEIDQYSIVQYFKKDGLPNNVVYAMLEDENGNLWFSTNRGISKLNLDEEKFSNYDVSYGLQSNEFNIGSYFKSMSGEMFFGGFNGLNSFYPDSIKNNPHIPKVVITDFLLLNVPVKIGKDSPLKKTILETKEIVLSYNQKVFTFEYSSLDYTSPERNKYSYKMEGFDENWIDAGTRRAATYTNLDPGNYVFKVMGSNNDGVWSNEAAAVIITITPPPWKTWWAYTIYAFIFIATLVGLRKYELNKRRHNEEERLRRAREAAKLREAELLAKTIQAEKEIEKQQIRTRIATDLHDEIGSNLSSISLISGMIQNQPGLSKEIKEALLDVNRAAGKSTESIRDIVWFINPMSDQLSDLISRLKESANSMLANIKFNFVSPETESVKKINPEVKRNVYLIFKEILNNIIKHSQASQININIKEDGNIFSISIEDNGVGFEESTVKKGNGLLNLRSRAEQINGKLDILTSLGEGTKITLQLDIT